jgi:hypothetical protein
LVLLVNRPTALADPVAVRVSVRSARALGRMFPLKLRDPLTGPYKLPVVAGNVAPDLPCHVPRTGSSLRARDLRQVGPARGAALSAFSAPAAVAAAYDAGCGLPYPSAFRQAVKGSGPPGCAPGAAQQGALCCPPNAMCAPGPTPEPFPPGPVPPGSPPPRCQPCNPRPGYACPLVAQPAICPAVAPAAKRVAPAAPH